MYRLYTKYLQSIYSWNLSIIWYFFFYSVLKMTVVMNQPTNSIILTMNSCKILNFISLWWRWRCSLPGGSRTRSPTWPPSLSGWCWQPGPGRDRPGGRGLRSGGSCSWWLAGWLVVSSELQGDYWCSQHIWIILYSLDLPEIEIIFRPHCSPPLFRRLNIRFIIITRKYKNVRNCSVFTF